MPLVSSFQLSKKQKTVVEPQIDYTTTPPTIHFTDIKSDITPLEDTINKRGGRCIACSSFVALSHVRSQGKTHSMGTQLMAIVVEGKNGRLYIAPNREHNIVADLAKPTWLPEGNISPNTRDFRPPLYGMAAFGDLFTPRQLVTLTTFGDLIQDARKKVLKDAILAGMSHEKISLNNGGAGANAYSDAIATYLALAIDKGADYWSSICSWHSGRDIIRNTFARQAIPMVWDFAEANPFSDSTGNFLSAVNWIAEVIEASPCKQHGEARLGSILDEQTFAHSPKEVYQQDATVTVNGLKSAIISTDPPYYDNIGYADLSDFFYVWLRRSLSTIYPDLFETLLTPKENELVADPVRFGNKEKAREFFETHLRDIFTKMHEMQNNDYPLTLFYAFKQADTETVSKETSNGHDIKMRASTGWETMLESLIQAGFTITGTWPIRTEMMNRSVSIGANALASSIVLVCRPRREATIASRRQFINELRAELGNAVKTMQHSSIAPVDLAQASIGPGMAIYSRYNQVIEADGSPLSVRTALQLINRELDAILAEQEGEYDMETRWAIAWFEEHAMNMGDYGRAEILSKAKNTSIDRMNAGGILSSKAGKVRLLKRDEFPHSWQPDRQHLTVWEVMQRTIHALDKQSGQGAGTILASVPQYSEMVRDLAYRLYSICDRKGWSHEATYYNMLITSWSDISDQMRKLTSVPQQMSLSTKN